MKKEVFRYIIKTLGMTEENILDHALKGHGFHTKEAAENKLKEKISEAAYGMEETDFWTQRFLYKTYKEEHEKYKDATVVEIKITIEFGE